jgi:hypothetical protein
VIDEFVMVYQPRKEVKAAAEVQGEPISVVAAGQSQNDANIDFLALARKSILYHSAHHFVSTFGT